MRTSKLFGKTLRDNPAEAELVSHRLMLRAGFISQVISGVYSYLPLAWRSLRKIENIIREEMDAAGGQELRLPALQPKDLWDISGRTETMGDDLFTLEDRRNRSLIVAPTHEEILTKLVASNINSYRDLPVILYQIQTKFRDEPRPRGGLIRVREFDMKDAYSFDVDDKGLCQSYESMREAYKRIYARCGIPTVIVEADSGAIGGKDSDEFIMLSDVGEDTVLLCETCGYAANSEKAQFERLKLESKPLQPLEEIHTPGIKTIEELAGFMKIDTNRTLKAVFYIADDDLIFTVTRGDLEINEIKLSRLLKTSTVRLAKPDEVKQAGLVAGSASPIGLSGIKTVADHSIQLGSNFVVGANKPDYHLNNTNYPRDFQIDILGDIALAKEGHICSNCPSALVAQRGIEVGHIFKVGPRYSESLGAYFVDQDRKQHPILMGCYGIGVGRLLAAAVEHHNDRNGIVLPPAISPYSVWLTSLNSNKENVKNTAESFYQNLLAEGIEVLYDDRHESAGVKLNDADLIGLPIRIVISPRNLNKGIIEVKRRSDANAMTVPADDAVSRIKELLETLQY